MWSPPLERTIALSHGVAFVSVALDGYVADVDDGDAAATGLEGLNL